MSDLERELEQELHRVLDPLSALPIPARRSPLHASMAKTLAGGAGAALTAKVLTAVAVGAAAVSIAGVATTGSLNPANWGQQVQERVESCKAQLAAGQHGIGGCVSPFASQHGLAVSSAARQHGNGNGNGNGHSQGNGNTNGHAKDKSDDHVKTTEPPAVQPGSGTTTGHGGPSPH